MQEFILVGVSDEDPAPDLTICGIEMAHPDPCFAAFGPGSSTVKMASKKENI